MAFPSNFLWGCATSAYQIEGSPLADGAGPSNWHRFAHTPGRIVNGDTGDVACDHYRRFQDDVELMHSLQLGAYRFSISWSRVLPQGTGRINPAGLGFYERLVDSLLARGIQPMATLYHWDLPAALDDRGGWLNPDIVRWFADYADVVFRKLDDRIRYWTTLNEPWVAMNDGYVFRSYFDLLRHYAFRPKEPVVHPVLRRSPEPGRAFQPRVGSFSGARSAPVPAKPHRE